MALPGGKYFIHDELDKLHPHHESFSSLWETLWKPAAKDMRYPFLFTDDVDFEPVVAELARLGMKEPYEWQSFASCFEPQASKLFETAVAAERVGQSEKASEYYLRASNVWFISRYPAVLCDAQRNAWERSKVASMKGLQLRGIPIQEELVPHKHGLSGEGENVPIWISLPDDASEEQPAPILLVMGGLDTWRPEMASWAGLLRRCGIGMVLAEIPGTGDSPAFSDDPKSPDRQWSSLLDWIKDHKKIDSQKVVGWGISTGGYYAIRAAYTHPQSFLGMVAHGSGAHHCFDSEWLENIDQREFAHSLREAFAWKWGFKGDVEKLVNEASDKFSLLKDGTLDKPECARLLLLNGIDDAVLPVDDSYLCLEHGPPKEARFFRNEAHMGGKESYIAMVRWVLSVLGIHMNPAEVMGELNYRPKYRQ